MKAGFEPIPRKNRHKAACFALLALWSAFAVLWSWFEAGCAHALPAVQRIELSNGLVVLILEEHSIPLVTFKLLVDAGSKRDPSGEEGLANLTSQTLLQGTAERSATVLNDELDSMGSSLNAVCRRDFTTLSLQTLREDMDKGFGIFMETLTQPAFSDDEIQRQIEITRGEIRSSEDQPMEVAQKAFHKALFLNSPYAHPVKGTEESVAKISRDAMVRFYQSYYCPNGSILAIAGDITVSEAKAGFLPAIEKWQSRQVAQAQFDTTFASGPKRVEVNRAVTQASIIIGHAGVERTNPDYYALSVMNYILGGGSFSSRLMEEVRIKRGLAYALDSSFVYHKQPGSFEIAIQTKNSTVEECIALAVEQMEKIQKEPVSENELETAKKYLMGSFPLKFSTQDDLTEIFSQIEYYGLGMDYPEKYPAIIAAITRDDVLRVAKAYLHPEKCIVVVVGNLKEERRQESEDRRQKD